MVGRTAVSSQDSLFIYTARSRGNAKGLSYPRTGKKTIYFCNNRGNPAASKMTQQAKKVSATKSEDLTLMPRNQKVKGRTSSYE